MSSLHNSESTGEEHESTQLSDLDSVVQYKELEQIYNKLIVTNGKVNYGLPMQRTLIPGAHARKLGIRLKTAKQLSEKRQESRQRLKTAAPRLELSSQERVDIMISPLPTEQISRTRVGTAFVTNPAPRQLTMMTERTAARSAPPAPQRVRETLNNNSANRIGEISNSTTTKLQSYSSLAMYSPQTQRFTMEQLALKQTRILKRLSHIQPHRVEKKFYVSGAPCDLKERYSIDEEQYELFMDITNKDKSTNKQLAPTNLSKSVLQHFSPHLITSHSFSRPPANRKTQGKQVSLQINNHNRQEKLSSSGLSSFSERETQKAPLQANREDQHGQPVQALEQGKMDSPRNESIEMEELGNEEQIDTGDAELRPSLSEKTNSIQKLAVEAEKILQSESDVIGEKSEKERLAENDETPVQNQ